MPKPFSVTGLLNAAMNSLFQLRQFDAVLRTFRSGHAGQHGGQIEFQFLRISDFAFLGNAPQALRLIIIFVGLDRLLAAAGGAEIIRAFGVNREKAHRGAVFGRHVGNRGAVHQRQRRRAGTEKFHELAHHLRLAQQLRDGQRHVRGGDPFADGAGQMDAHHVGGEEINRLAEHARLGFDAADAPAHDAQAVDHGGVRIRAHQGVGIIHAVRFQHAFGEVFQIHLMHDADARRHHLEGVERLHAPFQKLVALAVAREFQVQIARHGIRAAGKIHLHRVVHHQVHRHQRLDDLRILAQLGHGAAHGRQVHQQRHPGEILQHDARDHERDFRRARLRRLPVGQFPHVRLAHLLAVAIAQDGFQDQPDGNGQFGDGADAGLFQRGQRIEFSAVAVAEFKALQRAK